MRIDDTVLRTDSTKRHDASQRLLVEAREVLLGTQVFLVFQFVAMLLRGFEQLPVASQYVHFASLALIMFSTVLLLVPGATRRRGMYNRNPQRYYRFASRVVLAALVLLALGLAADAFVAVHKVSGSWTAGLIAGLLLLSGCLGLWLSCGWLAATTGRHR